MAARRRSLAEQLREVGRNLQTSRKSLAEIDAQFTQPTRSLAEIVGDKPTELPKAKLCKASIHDQHSTIQ